MKFHHIGKPVALETIKNHPKVKYSQIFDMYSLDQENSLGIPIELHAFGSNSTLHPLIQKEPHVAFTCSNIEDLLVGQEILMPLYEPFENYRCAMILLHQQPVELIETSLTEEEIWGEAPFKKSLLYPENTEKNLLKQNTYSLAQERFGLLSGAVWIAAISLLILLTLTIGIKFSWITIPAAVVLELILLVIFPQNKLKPD